MHFLFNFWKDRMPIISVSDYHFMQSGEEIFVSCPSLWQIAMGSDKTQDAEETCASLSGGLGRGQLRVGLQSEKGEAKAHHRTAKRIGGWISALERLGHSQDKLGRWEIGSDAHQGLQVDVGPQTQRDSLGGKKCNAKYLKSNLLIHTINWSHCCDLL